ncbi:GTPase Era [Henriciella aquimarina]|uniref:GTPase Era n=1 Tax=Henriciella aquimarina TaxID=545261 RepID=UPI000A017C7C|nr:GTPase Era [Henriciella aquimarina]
MEAEDIRRAGFVAIIGAPNAGKSTLTNALVGTKVAIVTHKVQTTRFPVRGIAHTDDTQLVIVDTPGIFGASRRLDRAMVKAAWTGADDADAVVHLVDAAAWIADKEGAATPAQTRSVADDRALIETLKSSGRKVMLALNKIDLFPHEQVLPLMAEFNEMGVYSDIFMISAEKGDGMDVLLKALADRMPEGGALYPPEQSADIPARLLAAEITREKLMLRLHEELPYQLTVETETWEDFRNGDVKIQQAVIVGRESHKSMVLGRSGQTIKAVSKAARKEMSELFDRRVHLFLFVKVDEKWQEKRESYAHLGLEFDT